MDDDTKEYFNKILKSMEQLNENMENLVYHMEDLKNLFIKYDLELEDYDEARREG